MAAGFLPNEGIGDQLKYILSAPIPGVLSWEMWLFRNNITPTPATILDDLEEANFQGYSRATLDRESWTEPVVNDGCAHSTFGTDPLVWTVTGGPEQTLYGYALVDPGNGVIRFIQRFDDADIFALTVGAKVKVLPRYTLTSAECDE